MRGICEIKKVSESFTADTETNAAFSKETDERK